MARALPYIGVLPRLSLVGLRTNSLVIAPWPDAAIAIVIAVNFLVCHLAIGLNKKFADSNSVRFS